MPAINLRTTSFKVSLVIFLCLMPSLNARPLTRSQRQTSGLSYGLANTNISSYPPYGSVNPIDSYNVRQQDPTAYDNYPTYSEVYNRLDRNSYDSGYGYSDDDGLNKNYGYGYGYGAGRWRGFKVGKPNYGSRSVPQPQYGVKY